MEMKNTFVELEQFEELTPEVWRKWMVEGFLKIFTIGYIYAQSQDSILIKMC